MNPNNRIAVSIIALLALVAGLLVSSAPASAAGTPDLAISASASSPLYGETGTVSVTASLPSGQPKGYNLAFRVVLPKGISYAGGAEFAPTVIADKPNTGETTLLFNNISDLVPNSSQGISFEVNHDKTLFDVGSTYKIDYEAFINTDPRIMPDFDGAGAPIVASSTGNASTSTTSRINAIKISKSEPSREGEILRGVHNHQTIYTLKVRNNLVNPTKGTAIDDWLPADLEFLGCEGDPDNTTDAPTNPGSSEEYPGSGPIKINPVDDCYKPVLVETVMADPDGSGPMPEAVYTHVGWDTGDLAPGQEITYRYRAAVPLSENTLEWSGTEPTPESGAQAANLDNNAVKPALEIQDEQKIVNYAIATGEYQSNTVPFNVSDETTLERTAEDLVVYKSNLTSNQLAQNAINTWELRFRTGEYRYSDEIVVTDTLPSGLCPLGPQNYTTNNDSSDKECDPTGDNPSVPYRDVTENADGTFTITWDKSVLAKLGHTDVSDEFVITFPTRTRSHYQADFKPSTPLLARDSISNKVNLTGDAYSRCVDPGTPDCATPGPQIWSDGQQPEPVVDASSAGQSAPGVVLSKQVAESGSNCVTATWVNTIPTYQPGDTICWRVTLDFPANVDTRQLRVTDFLPRNAAYVPGSYADTSANTTDNAIDTSMSANGVLFWDINDVYVPKGSQKFQVTFKTTIEPTGVLPPVDIEGNLAKFAYSNTAGTSFPLRDQADFQTVTPTLELKKGVRQVDSGTVNNPPIDGVTVRGGNIVTYQVDVKSTRDTKDIQVWDQLPAAYDCSMVSSISDSGICVDGGSGVDRIKWTVPAINDGSTKSLTYKVAIPGTFGPENTYVNKAGVRQYESDTNTGGRYIYTPQNNIDPANPRTPNVPRVDDESNVKTPNVGLVKTRSTSISETGNSASSQATIGELINYTVTATLPQGTTFGKNAKITDTPNSATTQPLTGPATALLNGSPLPAGWSIATVGQTITVNIPDNYVVPVGSDHTVTITFQTRVTDVSANVRGQNRTNQANIAWTDGSARSKNSNSVSTTIVEPLISQTKTNNKSSNAKPNDVVTYTLVTANSNSSNVSIAHDVVIKDVVPAGITLIDGGGNPLADGAVVPGTGGATWNAATRTITSAASPAININPGSNVTWTYQAKIDSPAVAGSVFTNTANARTTSIDGSNPNERTASSGTNTGYVASSSSNVRVGGSSVTKSVDPAWVTIGTPMTYKATVTIPKNLKFFNLTVLDLLPDSIDFDGYVGSSCISGCSVSNPAPTVQNYNAQVAPSATTIGWDLGTVDAGSADRVIEFTYKAHVRDTHRNGGAKVLAGENIVNKVNSMSNTSVKFTFDPNVIRPTNGFDHLSPEAKTTTPVREPKVTLDKKVKIGAGSFVDGPAQSQPGDALTYRIVVTNSGTSPAYDLVVDDMPDAELTNVVLDQGSSFNTKAWSAGDRSMRWVIPGPVNPGQSVTLTYTANAVSSAQLANGDSAINTAGSSYWGIPVAERTNPWTYRGYDSNQDTVRIDFEFPELTVVKTTAAPGFPDIADAQVEQPFGWRIVVTNSATTAKAFDTVVRDVLPPHWTYNAGSTVITGATGGDPSVATDPAGDVLTWSFNGQVIQPGASVVIRFTATPQLPARANPPVQVNDADATTRDASGANGNKTGPYKDEDDAKATLKFPIADLKIEKSAPAQVNVLDEFDYVLKVTNKGPDTATQVAISDPLPAGLQFVSSADCTAAISCSLGTMVSGASKTVTIRVKATFAAGGNTVHNVATVTGKEWEPTPEDNTDDADTFVVGVPDLKITKTAVPTNARPGQTVTYTLKAENIGNARAENVVITDPVPVGLTFVSADAPCVEAAGTVTCAIGSLDPGEVKTYQVKATVDQWGDADPTQNHQLDVQKVETQIDLNPGEVKTIQAVCPSGYFASDGSVRIDHVDQGTGDWTAPQVLESRAAGLDRWQGTVKNTATGRVQAKIFAVCIQKQTVADGTHTHDLIVSDAITVTDLVPVAGKKTATLMCGPGQIAIQPGFQSDKEADLVYSEPEGNGWKFVLDVSEPAQVTFSIRCMTRQVSVTDGHTHDLAFEHLVKEFTIPAGTVSEAQLTCSDGGKGIVADMDLDDGLVSLGNDPRPVTRAFKIYNPTDSDLKARLSLLCLGLRTAGEHVPPKVLQNTAYISTTSLEEITTNNHSTATVIAEDTDIHEPIDPVDPVKPTPNNPVAKTIVGKGVSYSASGVTFTLKCTGACGGTAKLSTLSRVKAGGKQFAKGTVLAKRTYFVGKAGTKKIKLGLTRAGKAILKSGKAKKAILRVSGKTAKVVKVGRR
ncbi:MAG: DUF11 domain-containing protein [Solirubrobacterales bacterium]|nr:DUF11 domain-containing protein [Solirubrobacterales bacterium]